MKRTRVTWSNDVDQIEGPCIVCGKEVRFVIPSDRPDPSLLYHSTCDMMPMIREHLKTATPPPLMPSEYVISKPKPVAPAAVAPTPAPVPAAPPATPPATPQ